MDKIGKIEAAKRQLDTAIDLYFDNKDGLSIHTLGFASFRLLFDVYPHNSNDDFKDRLDELIKKIGWTRFVKVANFLKHADNDPFELLSEQEADHALPIMGMAAKLHHRLTGIMSPQMRAFDAWMHVLNPDVFDLPPDPDPRFDQEFRKSVEVLKGAPVEIQLNLGKALIAFYATNPTVGGFGAPRNPVTLEPL